MRTENGAALDRREEGACARLERRRRGVLLEQAGAHDRDGFRRRRGEGLGRNGARRTAVKDERAAGAKAGDGGLGGVAADGIVDQRETLAAAESGHASGGVLPPIVDDVAAAMRLGEAALVVAADAADDGGAPMGEPLAEKKAGAARRRMDEHAVAGPERRTLVKQILRGHALEHGGGGLLEADAVGQPDQRVRADGAEPRIGAGRRARIGDAIALLERPHRTADRLHDARSFEADDPGKPRRREHAAALIGVEEVEPDSLLHEPHLAGAGVRNPDVVDAQRLRAAGRVNPHGPGLDRQPRAGALRLAVHRREDAGELALAGVNHAISPGAVRCGLGQRRLDRRLNGRRRGHGCSWWETSGKRSPPCGARPGSQVSWTCILGPPFRPWPAAPARPTVRSDGEDGSG